MACNDSQPIGGTEESEMAVGAFGAAPGFKASSGYRSGYWESVIVDLRLKSCPPLRSSKDSTVYTLMAAEAVMEAVEGVWAEGVVLSASQPATVDWPAGVLAAQDGVAAARRFMREVFVACGSNGTHLKSVCETAWVAGDSGSMLLAGLWDRAALAAQPGYMVRRIKAQGAAPAGAAAPAAVAGGKRAHNSGEGKEEEVGPICT